MKTKFLLFALLIFKYALVYESNVLIIGTGIILFSSCTNSNTELNNKITELEKQVKQLQHSDSIKDNKIDSIISVKHTIKNNNITTYNTNQLEKMHTYQCSKCRTVVQLSHQPSMGIGNVCPAGGYHSWHEIR